MFTAAPARKIKEEGPSDPNGTSSPPSLAPQVMADVCFSHEGHDETMLYDSMQSCAQSAPRHPSS
jgi:hypothetical protein